jgi:hypothetical protein
MSDFVMKGIKFRSKSLLFRPVSSGSFPMRVDLVEGAVVRDVLEVFISSREQCVHYGLHPSGSGLWVGCDEDIREYAVVDVARGTELQSVGGCDGQVVYGIIAVTVTVTASGVIV